MAVTYSNTIKDNRMTQVLNGIDAGTSFGYIEICGDVIPQQAEVTQGGGGYKEKEKHLPYKGHPWIDGPIRRYIDEVEPEIVEAVIEAVAEVAEKRTVQNKDVEAAQAEKALRERLASKHQAWKEMYAQLIRLEYERREQEYEDAQIAMLLFDL